MNNLESIYFSILRSALWNTPLFFPSPLSNEMWNEIYAISKEQTVTGIMLDAISKLPPEQKPPTELLLKWVIQQRVIEQKNIIMNKVLIELINKFNNHNIQVYVLKGQGVAQNYPRPTHRICGDIDLYFKEKDFEQAVELLKSSGCPIEGNPNETHHETQYNNIKLELHKKSATFFTNKLQAKYNKITSTALEKERAFETINDTEIEVLPHEANSLQLLSHMLRHIITAGLGLRQVCDWVLYTNKHLNDNNKEQFLTNIKELDLLQTYKAISAIATDYLGLPKEKVVCEINDKDKRLAKKVFKIIMEYGNFGQYSEHSQPANIWEYIKMFAWKFGNCIRLHDLARRETRNYLLWKYHFVDD